MLFRLGLALKDMLGGKQEYSAIEHRGWERNPRRVPLSPPGEGSAGGGLAEEQARGGHAGPRSRLVVPQK